MRTCNFSTSLRFLSALTLLVSGVALSLRAQTFTPTTSLEQPLGTPVGTQCGGASVNLVARGLAPYGKVASLNAVTSSANAIPITGAASLFDGGDFTIEGWVKLNSSDPNQVFSAFFKSGTEYFDITVGPSFVVVFGANTSSNSLNIASTFTVGKWYHLAVTKSGTTITVYKDGTSIGSSALVPIFSGAPVVSSVGASTASSFTTTASFDEMRYWDNTARSATDIQNNRALSGIAGPASTLDFNSGVAAGSITYPQQDVYSYDWAGSLPDPAATFNESVQITLNTVTSVTAANYVLNVSPVAANFGGTVPSIGTSAQVNFNVNPTPEMAPISPVTAGCIGSLVTVPAFATSNGVGGATFSWTATATSGSPIGIAASGTGNISFTATGAGTATVTVTPSFTSGGKTCTGSPQVFTITTTATATATNQTFTACATSGPNSAVRNTAIFDLTATPITSAIGAGTVTWFSNPAATVPLVSPSAFSVTNTATVYAKVSNGSCEATATITLNVRGATLTRDAGVNLCAGNVIPFTVTLSNGSNPTNYVWNGATIQSSQPTLSTASQSYGSIANQTVQVTAVDVNGDAACDITTSLTFNVNALPTINPIDPDPTPDGIVFTGGTCAGSTITIDGNATADPNVSVGASIVNHSFTVSPTSGVTITTFPAAGIPSADLAQFVATNTGTYTIEYRVTDNNGCISAPLTRPITLVDGLVVAGFPTGTNVCSDEVVSVSGITVTRAGNPVTVTYTWSLDGGTTPGSAMGGTLTGNASGSVRWNNVSNDTSLHRLTLTVSEVGGNGCSATSTTVYTVLPEPTGLALATPPAPDPVCSGATITTLAVVDNGSTHADITNGTLRPHFVGLTTAGAWFKDNGTSLGTSFPSSINNTGLALVDTAIEFVRSYTFPAAFGSKVCYSDTFDVNIDVKPEPVLATGTNAPDGVGIICSGSALNYNLADSMKQSGVTFTYTAAQTTGSVSGFANRTVASGANITDVLSGNGTVTYTVTPYLGTTPTCSGDNFDVVITVTGAPTASNITVTACSDAALGSGASLSTLFGQPGFCKIHLVSIDTDLPSSAGSTTAPASSGFTGGLYTFVPSTHTFTSTGTGETAADGLTNDAWTNTTAVVDSVVYNLVYEATSGCATPFILKARINPEPVITGPVAASVAPVCSDAQISGILPASDPGKVATTSWKVTAVNLPSGVTEATTNVTKASALPFTATDNEDLDNEEFNNSTSSDKTVTFTVVPVSASGCEGAAFDYTVVIRPELNPSFATSGPIEICEGSDVTITLSYNSTATSAGSSGIGLTGFTINGGAPTGAVNPTGGLTYELGASNFDISNTDASREFRIGYTVAYGTGMGTVCAETVSAASPDDRLVIDVDNTPTLSSPADFTVCSDGTITITYTTTVGEIAASAGNWNIAGPPRTYTAGPTYNVDEFTGAITNSGTTNVIYTFTASAENGKCNITNGSAVTDAVEVTVRPALTANVTLTSGSEATICSGSSSSVTFTGIANSTITYNINNGSNLTVALGPDGTENVSTGTLSADATYNIVSVAYDATPLCTKTFTAPLPSYTITVNNLNAGTIGSDQTICAGATPNALTSTAVATGDATPSYQWEFSTTNATTGFGNVASGGNLDGYAPGALTQSTWFRRVATTVVNGKTCTAATTAIAITVEPQPAAPSITEGADESVCEGTALDLNATGGVANSTFRWYSTNMARTSYTVAGTGTPYNIPGTTADGLYYYALVNRSDNGLRCESDTVHITVDVNPAPSVTFANTTQTVCSNEDILAVTATNTAATAGDVTTYTWTRTATPGTISLTGGTTTSGSSAGDIITGYLTNTATSPNVVTTFNITATAFGCATTYPNAVTLTTNISPIGSPVSGSVCSGNPITLNLSTTVANSATEYSVLQILNPGSLTASAGSPATGTFPASAPNGTGNFIADDVWVNSTTSDKTITYRVVPINGTCPGAAYNNVFTITPKNADLTPAAVCSGAQIGAGATLATSVAAPITYTITGVTGGLTAGPNTVASGSISATDLINDSWINTTGSTVNVVYTIQQTSVACTHTFTVTVPVQSQPVGTDPLTSTCSDVALNLDLATTTTLTGNTYSWSAAANGNVAGETTTTSTATSITDDLVNLTGSNQTVVYTVTPTSASGCVGASYTVTVTVKPEPVGVATPGTQTVCSDVAAAIAFSTSNNPGTTTYAWSTNAAAQGVTGDASGTGNVSEAFTNTTGSAKTVTFTVTPTADGCVGDNFTAAVTVSPEPVASATNSAQEVCSGTAIATMVLSETSGMAGTTTYAWTHNAPIGVTFSNTTGAGNISGTFTNTTGEPVTVTFTITPTNGCVGNAITATVIVNPLPSVAINAIDLNDNNDTFCEQFAQILGATISYGGVYTGPAGTSTYAWTATGGSIANAGLPMPVLSATVTPDATTSASGTVDLTYTDAKGCIATATPRAFTVDNTSQAGTITANTVAPLLQICESTPITLASTGTTGSFVKFERAYSSDESSAFGAFVTDPGTYTGTTADTLTHPRSSMTDVRAQFRAEYKNGECPAVVTAAPVTVRVDAGSEAGTIATTIAQANGALQTFSGPAVCSGSNTSLFTTSGFVGTINGWQLNNGTSASAGLASVAYTNFFTLNSDSIFTATVTVTNGLCAAATAVAEVDVYSIPEYYPVPVDVTCNGGANGTVQLNLYTLKAGDHTPTYSYSIDGGAYNTTIPNNLTAPTGSSSYGISVKDETTGCAVPQPGKPFLITQPATVVANTDPADQSVCFNTPVTLATTASGGSTRFIYAAGSTPLKPIVNGTPTTATVTIADMDAAYSPTINASSIIEVTLNIDHENVSDLRAVLTKDGCGSIELFNGIGGTGNNFVNTILRSNQITLVSSAAAPFTGTFLQTGNINTAPGSGFTTALNGCAVEGTWTLTVSDNANNSVDGLLRGFNLRVSADKAYTHVISPAAAVATVSGTNGTNGSFAFTPAPGLNSYTITSTDALGCTSSKTVNVNVNNELVLTAAKKSYNGADVSCFNATDGEVTLTVAAAPQNGTAPYQYKNGVAGTYGASNVFAGLAPGNYTFFVRDSYNPNCEASVPVTIINAVELIANAGADQTLCDGAAYTFTASATGGTGTLGYAWASSPNIASSATTTVGGTASNTTTANETNTFTVTVTDANGCVDTDVAILTERPRPTATINIASTPFCASSSATLTATPGTPGSIATYNWSTSGLGTLNTSVPASAVLTVDATALTAARTSGTVSLTVVDNFGCSSTSSAGTAFTAAFAVDAPVTASFLTASATVVCAGSTVDVDLDGGTFGTVSQWSVAGPYTTAGSPGSFTNVTGTASDYTTAALTHTQSSTAAQFWTVRANVVNGVCPAATRNVEITVNPTPDGGDAAITGKVVDGSPVSVTAGQTSSAICAAPGSTNNQHVLVTTGTFGTITGWEVRTTVGTAAAGAWTAIPSSASATYLAASLVTTIEQTVYEYRARVITGTAPNECVTYSNTITITVNPYPEFYPMGTDATCGLNNGGVLFGIYDNNLSDFEYQFGAAPFAPVTTPVDFLVASNSTGVRIRQISTGCVTPVKSFNVPGQGTVAPTMNVTPATPGNVCPLAPVTFTAAISGGNQNVAIYNNETPNPRPVINETAAAIVPITLTDASGEVISAASEIEVTLNLVHTETNDLDIYLVGPANCGAMLLASDNGNNGSSGGYIGTVLNTNTANPVVGTIGTSPFTGIFQPEGGIAVASTANGTLSVANDLIGCPVNGTWNLVVVDAEDPSFTGTVNNFGLRVVNPRAYAATISSGSTTAGLPGTTTVAAAPYTFTVNPDLDATPYALPNTATKTYTFNALDGRGCAFVSSPASINVTVQDLTAATVPTVANQTVNTDANACTALVSWNDPAITDNCTSTPAPRFTIDVNGTAIVTNATTLTSRSHTFDKGSNTVTYTVTDYAGNVSSTSFTVTVNDVQAPTFTTTPNATIALGSDTGDCGALFTYTITADDNCPGESLVQTAGLPSGALFPVGTTNNTFVVTDASGNTATYSFSVVVTDIEDPIIDNKTDLVYSADAGVCDKAVSAAALAITYSDNCAVTIGYTADNGAFPASGTGLTNLPAMTFENGVTTVTVTATDASGRTAVETFTVTVNDTEAPNIDATPNSAIVVANALNACERQINSGLTMTFADNCGVVSASYVATGAGFAGTAPATNMTITGGTTATLNGATFKVGTTTLVYTVADAAGNTDTYTFTVTVNDAQNPTVFSLPNLVVNVDANQCYATVNSAASLTPSYFDNCTAFGDLILTHELRQNNATGTLITPVPVAGIVGGAGGSYQFPIGVTHVKYLVRDGSNNTGTVEFTVTVNDNQAPVLANPGNQTLLLSASTGCTADYTIMDPISDNCTGTITWSYSTTGATVISGSHADGANSAARTFNLGTTTVTLNGTDNVGNAATSVSFTVTVVDDVNPMITTLAASADRNPAAGCQYTVAGTEFDVTATDNCVGAVTYELSVNGGAYAAATTAAGTVLTGTANTLSWRAKDAAGNYSAPVVFTVNVVDTEIPTIAGTDASVNRTPGAGCQYVVTGGEFDITGSADNCAVTATEVSINGGAFTAATSANGQTFGAGVHTIAWRVKDAAGNTSALRTFTVTVVDNQLPLIAATGTPGTTTRNMNMGTCTYTVTGTEFDATATDNCTVTLSLSIDGGAATTATTAAGTVLSAGSHTLVWTAVDGSGNAAASTVSYTVVVGDNQLPVISGQPLANINVNAGANCTAINVGLTAPAHSDNCSATLTPYVNYGTVNQATADGTTVYNLGTTVITWAAVDAAGNTTTATQNVIITDNTVPAFTATPAPVSTGTDAGVCNAVVTLGTPATSDNCGVASVIPTASGITFMGTTATFPKGITTVTWTVTDNAGLTATTTQDVLVVDDEAPTLTGGATPNATYCADAVLGTATVNWTHPIVADNCAGFTATYAINNGSPVAFTSGAAFTDVFTPGFYTVDYVVSDGVNANATASASFTVRTPLTVTFNKADIDCAGNTNGSIDVTVSGGIAPYAYTWVKTGTAGTFSTVEDLSGLGAGEYTLTVTDAGSSCANNTVVTIAAPGGGMVLNLVPTNVGCKGSASGSINLTVSGGTPFTTGAPYVYLWDDANATTSEDVTGLTALPGPGGSTYTVRVTDANGCDAYASTNVTQPANDFTVTADVDRTICQGAGTTLNTTVTSSNAGSTISYAWTPTSPVVTTPSILITNLDATTTFTVTATEVVNGGACSVTATGTITVVDRPLTTTPAVIEVCAGSPITFTGAPAGVTYAWSGPSSFSSTLQAPTIASATAANAGTYTLQASNLAPLATCQTTSRIQVIVNSTPATPVTTDATYCVGATLDAGMTATASALPTTVTRSFTVAGPDWSTGGGTLAATPLTIPVSGFPAGASMTGVSVTYKMAHTSAGHVALDLKSPLAATPVVVKATAGQVRNLGTASGEKLGAPVAYTFSTASATNINTVTADPIPSGAYQAPLSFTASDINGNWVATVTDATATGNGIVESVTLVITATVPAANATINWWNAATGGSIVGTGTPFQPLTSTAAAVPATSYFAVATNPVTGCVSARDEAVAAVNASVSLTITNPTPVCESDGAVVIDLDPTATGYSASGDALPYVVATGVPQSAIEIFDDPGFTSNAALQYASAVSTTLYVRAVDPGTGCKATGTIDVVVNAQTALDPSALDFNGGAVSTWITMDLINGTAPVNFGAQNAITPIGGQYYLFGSPITEVYPDEWGESFLDMYYVYYNGTCFSVYPFGLFIDDPSFRFSLALSATLMRDNMVALNWNATNLGLYSNSTFALERSVDGVHFEEIARIAHTGESQYSFEDQSAAQLSGKLIYRVRQINAKGGYLKSNAVEATPFTAVTFEVGNLFPNPTESATNFYVKSDVAGEAMVTVYDANGREILAQANELTVGSTLITLDVTNLAKGAYMVRISTSNGVATRKLIVE